MAPSLTMLASYDLALTTIGREQPFAKPTEHGRSLERYGRVVGQQNVSATLRLRVREVQCDDYAAIAMSCFQSLTIVFATESPLAVRPNSTVISRSPSNAGLSSRHR